MNDLDYFSEIRQRKKNFGKGGSSIKLLEFLSKYSEKMLLQVKRLNQTNKIRDLYFNNILPENRDLIQKRFELIFYHLSNRCLKISNEEINQFLSEYSRFVRYVDFALILTKGSANFLKTAPGTLNLYKKILAELKSIQVYSNDKDQNVCELLKQLGNQLKKASVVSEEERDMVFKAMGYGLRQGHWLVCSKGHYYMIGDCGGATTTGKCIECKETVGGTSYTLAHGSKRV